MNNDVIMDKNFLHVCVECLHLQHSTLHKGHSSRKNGTYLTNKNPKHYPDRMDLYLQVYNLP
jgi:ribosomal protein L33